MTTNADTDTYDALTAAHNGGFFRAAIDVLNRHSRRTDDYRTGHLTGYVEGRLAGRAPTPTVEAAPARVRFPLAPLDAEPAPAPATKPGPVSEPAPAPSDDILTEVTAIVADLTGYEAEMLTPDLSLEADLGIDDVKRERILAAVVERWSLTLPENIQIGDVPTLQMLADLARDNK